MTRSPSVSLTGLFRAAGIRHQRVTNVELFFDLVFAFAVTQVVSLLIVDQSPRHAFEAGLLLVAVWWTWMYTSWATNWLDPDKRPVRIMLLTVMGLSLAMSAILPKAFGIHGLEFALAYVGIQVGRSLFIIAASADHPLVRRNFQRIVAWECVSGGFWIAGGITDGTWRDVLWVIAAAIDLLGPLAGFATPGLGRSQTTDWQISGGHLAERCQLFILIVLGESIVDTGAAFSALDIGWREFLALVTAFAGSVGFWWIYFDRSADEGGRLIENASDPGRIGRSVYLYLQFPMIAGVAVSAVGDQLTIGNPRGDTSLSTALITLGGPALFIAGQFLFLRIGFGRTDFPLLYALGFLVCCLPVAVIAPPVVMGMLSTLAVLGIVVHMAQRRSGEALDRSSEPVGSSSSEVFF